MHIAQPAPERPRFILLGTVLGETTRIALCQLEGTRELIRLKVGEVLDGWTLHYLDSRHARFEKSERSSVLLLQSPAPISAAAAGATDSMQIAPPARRRKR
jgi:hypothetical protein